MKVNKKLLKKTLHHQLRYLDKRNSNGAQSSNNIGVRTSYQLDEIDTINDDEQDLFNDPEIVNEQPHIINKFPFIKYLDYKRPIDSRVRSQIKTKDDFEDVNKYNIMTPDEIELKKI